MPSTTETLMQFYDILLTHFGPQHWWPGESPFEVLVGAVLTQNTNWSNVEKAITNLKQHDLLDPHKLHQIDHNQLAQIIKPAGYFNVKAKRLKNIIAWLCDRYDGDLNALADWPVDRLREELLVVNGVGRETADSIILYALNKPTFVVDTYTCRILVRHQCLDADIDYESVKQFCENALPADTNLYNEFHALIVRTGKEFCKPRPKCDHCPLNGFPHNIEHPF